MKLQATNMEDDMVEQCDRCCGNGEIITDWSEYLNPSKDAGQDAGVATCPYCGGTGSNETEPTNTDGAHWSKQWIEDEEQAAFLEQYRTDDTFRRKHNWYEVLILAVLLAYVFSLSAFVAWGFWGIWM